LKILLWSDVHSHNHRPFASYEGGMNSRLGDSLRVIDQITERAADCDVSAFLGDLGHVSPFPVNVFNELYERVRKLSEACPLLMLAGNHDLRGKYYSGDPTDIPFLKFMDFPDVYIAEVIDPGKDIVADNIFGDTSVMAFNHRREEDAAAIIKASKGADILLMHQEIYGADNEFGYMFRGGVHPDDLKKFKWVFTGHIHKPQIIDEKVVLVGAPLHINFGDVGDRGFFILDTETDELEVVQTEYPRFVTVGLGDDHPDDGNFYRTAQAKEKQREALKIPDWQEAVDAYCKIQKRPELAKVGRSIAGSVHKETITPQPFSLERIELENYGVFEKAEYDVQSGLHMVLGEVADQPGRSNGAGKTTMFEAISWVIYGRTSKGVKGAAVMKRDRKRGKKCSGTIVMSSERGELKITRVQKAGGSTLEAWLGDHHESGRVPDTQEWIINTLGVDYDFFCQMVYFSQEQAEFFSQMGDADRKRILGTLLGTRWYEAAEKEAKTCRESVDTEIGENKSETAHEERVLLDVVDEKERAESELKRWDKDRGSRASTTRGSVSHLEEQLEGASAKADEEKGRIESERDEDLARLERGYETQKSELADMESGVSGIKKSFDKAAEETRGKLETVEEQRAGMEGVDAFRKRLAKTEKRLEVARADEKEMVAKQAGLDADHRGLMSQLSKVKGKIGRMENLKPGVRCSTCFSEITKENVAGCIKEAEAEASGFRNDVDEVEKKQGGVGEELREVAALMKEWTGEADSVRLDIQLVEGLDKKVADLRSKSEGFEQRKAAAVAEAREKAKTLEVRIEKDHQSGVNNVTKRFEGQMATFTSGQQTEVTKIETRLEETKETLGRIEAETNPHTEGLDRLTTKAADHQKALVELAEQAVTQEEARETFDFWVRGFGREGIRAALLHDFCRVFTDEVNSTLSQMRVGMQAELSPATALKKKGEVRDRLDYRITTDAGDMAYQELSGGEKVRVDLASMLALNLIASRHFGIEQGLFGILVLDEVFSALDEDGVEVVYQIINGFTARAMYVISHNAAMKSLFDSVIVVVKEGTRSVLAV